MMLSKRGFLKSLILTFTVCTAALNASDNQRARQLEKWNQSSFTPMPFTNLVNSDNCHTAGLGYWGCYAALYSIVEFLSEGNEILTFSTELQPYHGKVIKSFGALEIRELIKDKVPKIGSIKENFDLYISEKQLQTRIQQQVKKNRLPIEEVASYLISQAKPEEIKALHILGVNTFIQNAGDSHFAIMLSDYFTSRESGTRGEDYFGIGALIAQEGSKISLIKVYNNSSASEAGLMVGDIIVALNGTPLSPDENPESVSLKIRGPENTTVALEIQRGSTKKTLNVVRRKFIMQNMMTSIETTPTGSKALYISIEDFIEKDLCAKFTSTIAKAVVEKNISNVIVDLRNNGGGMMQTALCMVGSLATGGVKLLSIWDTQMQDFKEDYIVEGSGVFWTPRRRSFINETQPFSILSSIVATKNWLMSDAQPIALYDQKSEDSNILKATKLTNLMKGKKIVVLVNQKSASASEIFGGAIQDLGLGAVIGTKTFGKGCGQNIFDQTPEVTLKKTTFRFHFGSGHSNQKIGVLPDQVAFYNSEDKNNDKFILREAQIAPLSPPAVPFDGEINTEIKNKLKNCAPLQSSLSKLDETKDNQLAAALGAVTCL